MQNELMRYLFSLVREDVISPEQSRAVVSVQTDEIMDIATQYLLVLVLCYVDCEGENFELIPL